MSNAVPWLAVAKRASCIRDLDVSKISSIEQKLPNQGDVIICRIEYAMFPDAIIEDNCGRLQCVFPGDIIITTVASRESTRWSIGYVPVDEVFEEKRQFAVLSSQGIIGEFKESSSDGTTLSISVTILGVAIDQNRQTVRLDDLRHKVPLMPKTRSVPTVLVSGTSAEAGKTTGAITAIRLLKQRRYKVLALKAAGTGSLIEKYIYKDAGADIVFDFVDFGHPTTYPSSREEFLYEFKSILLYISGQDTEYLVAECGGDPFGANVPSFIAALKELQWPIFHVSAASDCVGAIGLVRHFREAGPRVDYICGRSCENPLLRERTSSLTGTLCGNLNDGSGIADLAEMMDNWIGVSLQPGG